MRRICLTLNRGRPFLDFIRRAPTDEPLAELTAIHDQIQEQWPPVATLDEVLCIQQV